MILISIGAAVAAALVNRSAMRRWGSWDAALVSVAVFLVIVGTAATLLPGVNEVPADFPATVLWRFRVTSLGSQLVLWTSLGLLFGLLTERVDEPHAVVPQRAVVE